MHVTMVGFDIYDTEDKRKGMLVSILVHLVLLLLCILPFIKADAEVVDVKTIYVSFSDADDTQAEMASPLSSSSQAHESDDVTEVMETEEETEVIDDVPIPAENVSEEAAKYSDESTRTKEQEVPIEPQKNTDSDISQDKAPLVRMASVSPSTKVEEPKENVPSAAELAAAKRKKLEAEKKRLEAEERKRKEEALKKQKSQFGSLFSGSEGDSEEQETTTEGVSTDAQDYIESTHKIGGGLGNRKVLYEPSITDKSQKTGRVVVKICVNEAGIVDYASYTQKGSTTTDSGLIKKAKEAAHRYRFSSSDVSKQCGTVSFDFRIR